MNFQFSEKEKKIHDAAFDCGIASNGLSFADRWMLAAKNGLTGINIPENFDGAGCSALETGIALEGFAEGCDDGGFTFSLAAHLLSGVIPVAYHASKKIQQHILPKVAAGNFILANAMTESASGSDAFALKTTAKQDGDFFILNGTKTFCTNAPIANGILAYALTDEKKGFFGGISCFLLEKEKHRFKVGATLKKTGLQSSPLAEIFLNDVRVEKENLVGTAGSGAMIFLESMVWERACISVMHTGVMARLCRITRDYVSACTRGEKKLSDHQAVQFRLAEMFLQTENSRLLAYRAAKMIDSKDDATIAAAEAKIFSSEALNRVARETILLHGANGITDEYKIAQILIDAQAAAIYSGPNDVLRGLIASRV